MGILELSGLTKEYRRGERAFNAVNGVSLSVERGDFISIIGRSGSGKSTLLNMSAGLLKPTAGTVLFDGQDIFRLADKSVSLLRNEKIGFVPQGMSLLANFTVLENVCIPWFLFKREGEPEERALVLLEKTGIDHLAASYPKELSGGEMRRVAIARALINKPELLIADEPTGELDAETTADIMKLLGDIARDGTAVLIVTHELDTLSYGNDEPRRRAAGYRRSVRYGLSADLIPLNTKSGVGSEPPQRGEVLNPLANKTYSMNSGNLSPHL